MAKMDVEGKVWQLPINVTENGDITKVLATADTYVDKNIEITVSTPDATFEIKKAAAVTATASTTDTTYTSDTETPYAIEIKADAVAGAVQVGVKDAGFAAATDVIDVAAATAETNTKTIYVKKGTLEGSGEASATSETVKLTKGGSGDFTITASAAGGASVTSAGWLYEGAHADASGDTVYAVQKMTLANAATDETEYQLIAGPILKSNDYLYINEGYLGNTKIPLKDLVPDDATVREIGSEFMYNTVSAYDNDGNLVTGTMGDATLSDITADDASATISTVAVTANADESAFKVTGTGAIEGEASVSIATRGLATTDLSKTGAIEGEAAVDATIAKIGLGIDADTAAITVTPVISKEDATTAKSGDITTTAPASGKFVAVSTAAIEASKTVSPKVTTAGYGTTEVFSATGATVTAGAEASGMYYIPIEAGSHTAEASDPTIVKATATVATTADASEGFDGDLTAGILSAAPSGEYITIDADATAVKGSVSGTVTCTATEGYITAGSETKSIAGDVDVEVTKASTKYIRVYDGTIL